MWCIILLMKLIVGLGNPGEKYAKTRHNAGFIALDAYAEKEKLGGWTMKDKFKSEIIEFSHRRKKVLLAKPQTYMNHSGRAVEALKNFYKLDNDDITVIHDELDLPFGEVKKNTGGGSAGNNGIGSIIDLIGDDFHRVRIGIRTNLADKKDSSDFVLSKLSDDEIQKIEALDLM